MFRLVCFDMDGVLVDACNLHKVALENAMLDVVGYKISDNDHYSKFNGLPTRKKLELLNIDKELIELINNKKQEYTISLIETNISIDQSKIDLLNFLVDTGYSLACVTNSIAKTTNIILKKVGILHYFNIVISNTDVKNPKPSPEPYLLAMSKLGFSPKDTIIVEDSLVGLKSATSSGAKVIKVSSPSEVNLKNLKKEFL